jgi:hypothetical protein
MTRSLQKLYAQIPRFQCIKGCTDCCGPVPSAPAERNRAPALMDLDTAADILEVLAKGGAAPGELAHAPALTGWLGNYGCLSCPYAQNGGCAIYDNRPFLCRLFGTVPSMPCPHGRGPTRMLTRKRERKLMKAYLEHF